MSKGSGQQPTSQTVTTQALPEYAQPYYEQLLTRTIGETTRPYVGYGGQRIAEFTPEEQRAMQNIQQMGSPQQISDATSIAQRIGGIQTGEVGPMVMPVTGASIASQFQPGTYQPGYQAGDITSGYAAGTPQGQFQQQSFEPQYQAGQFDAGYQAGQVNVPGLAQMPTQYGSQYTGQADLGGGFQAGTMADTAAIQQYMNPYQQLVTDIEKREAQRAADVQGANIGQQAAAAGGLGGYREAIMQSELQRNTAQQLQDIQSRGGQAAFQQAQQAFEQDRAARLQQAQEERARGTAGQQFLQQAEQFRQGAFGLGTQAQQAQAGLQLDAYRAGEQARQQAAQLGLSAQEQQERARQAQQQFQQEAFQLGQQERQFGSTFGLQQYQAGEQARQEAARLGLSAQEQQERARQAQEQFAQSAFQTNLGAQETAARLGLAGLSADQAQRAQELEAARLLGGFGAQQQAMDLGRFQAQQASGQIGRELTQRGLDMGYQDFLRQQAFPREQMAFLSNILQGLPVAPGTTQASYGAQPSNIQQALGTGIAGVGLYNALGRGFGG